MRSAVLEVYSRYHPGMYLEELMKTTIMAVKIAIMSAKIRTVYLPNTSLEPHRYAILRSC
jgi:hypothetical protein